MVLTTQLDQRDTILVEVDFQAGYTQLVHSTDANVLVMVLPDCKSTPQKSRPIESGHGRHAVQVANVCSYSMSLAKKMNFNFCAGFYMDSHIRIMKVNITTLVS